MLNRRHMLAGAATLVVGRIAPSSAQERFPSRNVQVVVPFTPGGPTDVVARLVAEAMSKTWSVPVIVENKPGAGTMIGTDYVAKARPDGYTFGIVITAHMINPAVRTRMPFDPLKDLRGVTQLIEAHVVLAAHPSFPAHDIPGLVRTAQTAKEPINYATPGVATGTHMAAELLQKAAGIKLEHVPYNGSAKALTDVLAGRVPLLFDVWHSVQQHVAENNLKILGVTNATRIPNAPQYPCISETYRGYEAGSIFGVVVPAKTPDDVVSRLSADIVSYVKTPEFAEKAKGLGVVPVGSSPAEFDRLVATDIEKWRAIASSANIRID